MNFMHVYLLFWSYIIIPNVMSDNKCKSTEFCLVPENRNTSISSVCDQSIHMSCGGNERMWITEIAVHKNNNDQTRCRQCWRNKRQECPLSNQEYKDIQNNLHRRCSYQNQCNLTSQFITPSCVSRRRMWYIAVTYCCVYPDHVIDACDVLPPTSISDTGHFVVNPSLQQNGWSSLKSVSTDTCQCTIQGIVDLVIVEYSYFQLSSNFCSNSRVYINAAEILTNCSSNCASYTCANITLATTSSTTVSIDGLSLGVFFWYAITGKDKETVSFSCNTKGTSIMPTSSTTISQFTSVSTSSSNPEKTDIITISPNVSITSDTDNGTTVQSPVVSTFPLTTIAIGSSSFVVAAAAITIAVILFMRSRTKKDSTESSYLYNGLQSQSQQRNNCSVTNNSYDETPYVGQLNQGRVLNNQHVITDTDNKGHLQETDEEEYATIVDGSNDKTKCLSVLYVNIGKSIQKHPAMSEDVNSNAESYRDNDYSTTADTRKHPDISSIYNTFESDEYSNFQGARNHHVTLTTDNYSHLTLRGDNEWNRGDNVCGVSDTYNHVSFIPGNQTKGTKGWESGHHFNAENV